MRPSDLRVRASHKGDWLEHRNPFPILPARPQWPQGFETESAEGTRLLNNGKPRKEYGRGLWPHWDRAVLNESKPRQRRMERGTQIPSLIRESREASQSEKGGRCIPGPQRQHPVSFYRSMQWSRHCARQTGELDSLFPGNRREARLERNQLSRMQRGHNSTSDSRSGRLRKQL